MRWRKVEAEFGDQIELQWKSFLLRPSPRQDEDQAAALEKFREYTRSWLKVAADDDAGEFQVWQSDEGPPSHSVPAHVVSKVAQRSGKKAFELIHERLMRAYFKENRDISRTDVLRELWLEVGLSRDAFEASNDASLVQELVQEIISDHNEAIEAGATGVPVVRLADNLTAMVGAHPIELYRNWIRRCIDRQSQQEANP